MSKILEILDCIKYTGYAPDYLKTPYTYLSNAYSEVQMDQANPSEVLECLEELEQNIKDRIILAEDRQLKLCATIKQALLKAQEQEKEIDRLENKCLDFIGDKIRLKYILGIIKEKPDIAMAVKRYSTYDNFKANNMNSNIAQKEFDLVKKYLG